MQKIYTQKNVYEAFCERMDYIFAEFDNIYVSFSGGKDSGVLYQLLLKYMQERNIDREIGLFHQDFEAQYEKTTEFVTRTFDTAPMHVKKYWCCLPMACKTNLSNYELYWHPWDEEKRNTWVRPMPERPEVINLQNNPISTYKHKMLQEDFSKQFGRWYRDMHSGGKTIALLGLRADESLHRYSAIVNKRHGYKGTPYISPLFKDVWAASPLYDWTTQDIWTATGKFRFDYNHLYDLMHKAGVSLSEMRVASPFNEWAAQSLNLYRIIEPQTWSKLVGRVQGANFGAIYGASKALGYREVTLPAGHTWKSYTLFLLETLPPDLRDQYWTKFQTSIKFWAEKGGGFAPEVIAEIEECGYKIKRNGISNYSKDGKERIVFEQDTPDNTDDVKGTIDIPSWKRMCFCILKNDHLCRFMGFGPTKVDQEKIKAIKSKYQALARGETL